MAEENGGWGYRRIQRALSTLGHELARTTIANILRRHGIDPTPERNPKDDVEKVSTSTWVPNRCDGFLHSGGVDVYRSETVYRSILHRPVDETR